MNPYRNVQSPKYQSISDWFAQILQNPSESGHVSKAFPPNTSQGDRLGNINISVSETTMKKPKMQINIQNLCEPALQIVKAVTLGNPYNVKLININAIDKYFRNLQKKLTKGCPFYIEPQTEQCYLCEDCQIQGKQNKSSISESQIKRKHSLFCKHCFEEEIHKDHTYYIHYSNQLLSQCNCGNAQFLKPDSFCSKHKIDRSYRLSQQVSQKERQTFLHTFGYLMDLIVYFSSEGELPNYSHYFIFDISEQVWNSKQLAFEILNKLLIINTQNIKYRTLTMELLLSKSKYIGQIQLQNQISKHMKAQAQHRNQKPQNQTGSITGQKYQTKVQSHFSKQIFHTNLCTMMNATDIKELLILLCSNKNQSDSLSSQQGKTQNKQIIIKLIKYLSVLAYSIQYANSTFKKQLSQIFSGLSNTMSVSEIQQFIQQQKFYPHWYFYGKLIKYKQIMRIIKNNPSEQVRKISTKLQIRLYQQFFNKSKIISLLVIILSKINNQKSQQLMSQIFSATGNNHQNNEHMKQDTKNPLKYYVIRTIQILSKSPQNEQTQQFVRNLILKQYQMIPYGDQQAETCQYLAVLMLAIYPSNVPQPIEPFCELVFGLGQRSKTVKNKFRTRANQQGKKSNETQDQFNLNESEMQQLQKYYLIQPAHITQTKIMILKFISISSQSSFHKLYNQNQLTNLVQQYSTFQNNQNNKDTHQNYRHKIGWFQTKLQYFLQKTFLNSKTLCTAEKEKDYEQYFIIFSIATIEYYEKKSPQKLCQIINKIWKNILISPDPSILSVVNNLFNFLKVILKGDRSIISLNNRIKMARKSLLGSSQFQNNQSITEQSQNVEHMKMWFIQILRNVGQIKKLSLLQLRDKGFIQFGNSENESQRSQLYRILQSYCNYVQSGQGTFRSKGLEKNNRQYKYGKWVYDYTYLQQLQSTYKCPPSCFYTENQFDFQDSFIPGKITLKLFEHFFSSDIVYKILNHFWQNYDMQVADCSKKYEKPQQQIQKCGYIYLFILIQIDKINKILIQNPSKIPYEHRQWQKHLRNKLQNLRQNPQQLQHNYFDKHEEYELICKLFKQGQKELKQQKLPSSTIISVKQQVKKVDSSKKSQEQSIVQRRNQKSNAIKQKRYEKFKKSQNRILQKHDIIPSADIPQQSNEICLLCHQNQREHKINQQHQQIENSFVYLSHLNSQNTFCTIFYGSDCNMASTLMSTCFHGVHLKCYIKLKQNQNNNQWLFLCPLCAAKTNCIIPKNSHTKNANTVCYNLLSASLITNYKLYYFHDSMFMLYFKHLVQSLGLNSVLMPNFNASSVMNSDGDAIYQLSRFNSYALKNLQSMWDSMGETDRKQSQKQMEKFISKIQNTCKKNILKLVQIIMARCIRYGIFNSSSKFCENMQLYDQQIEKQHQEIMLLLKQLSSLLVESQFSVIKNNARALTKSYFHQTQNNQQKQKQPKQQSIISKQTLGFKLQNLPESLKKLEEYIQICKCSYCDKKIDLGFDQDYVRKPHGSLKSEMCLFCGQIVCHQCQGIHRHWLKRHCDYKLSIQFSTFELICKKKDRGSTETIYYNDFMIPYSKRFPYHVENDGFWLWDFKVQRVLAEFLNL